MPESLSLVFSVYLEGRPLGRNSYMLGLKEIRKMIFFVNPAWTNSALSSQSYSDQFSKYFCIKI